MTWDIIRVCSLILIILSLSFVFWLFQVVLVLTKRRVVHPPCVLLLALCLKKNVLELVLLPWRMKSVKMEGEVSWLSIFRLHWISFSKRAAVSGAFVILLGQRLWCLYELVTTVLSKVNLYPRNTTRTFFCFIRVLKGTHCPLICLGNCISRGQTRRTAK